MKRMILKMIKGVEDWWDRLTNVFSINDLIACIYTKRGTKLLERLILAWSPKEQVKLQNKTKASQTTHWKRIDVAKSFYNFVSPRLWSMELTDKLAEKENKMNFEISLNS